MCAPFQYLQQIFDKSFNEYFTDDESLPKYTELDEMPSDYAIIHIESTELIIKESELSQCTKILRDYFHKIISDHNYAYLINTNELLQQITFLEKSPDEELCCNMLQDIDILSIYKILDMIDESWNYRRRSRIAMYRDIISSGIYHQHSKKVMIAKLWLLYRRFTPLITENFTQL